MTLDEILKLSEGPIGVPNKFDDYFRAYIKTTGIENVRKDHLDRIINKFGINIFEYNQFADLYKVKAADETNGFMKKWTLVIGCFTIAMTVMTLIMLLQ